MKFWLKGRCCADHVPFRCFLWFFNNPTTSPLVHLSKLPIFFLTQVYFSLFSFSIFLKVELTVFPFIPPAYIHSPLLSIALIPWLPQPPAFLFSLIFVPFSADFSLSLSHTLFHSFFPSIMSHWLLIAINFLVYFSLLLNKCQKRMESWEGEMIIWETESWVARGEGFKLGQINWMQAEGCKDKWREWKKET